LSSVYGLDTGPLQAFVEEVREYYEELSKRLSEQARPEIPDDRMYT